MNACSLNHCAICDQERGTELFRHYTYAAFSVPLEELVHVVNRVTGAPSVESWLDLRWVRQRIAALEEDGESWEAARAEWLGRILTLPADSDYDARGVCQCGCKASTNPEGLRESMASWEDVGADGKRDTENRESYRYEDGWPSGPRIPRERLEAEAFIEDPPETDDDGRPWGDLVADVFEPSINGPEAPETDRGDFAPGVDDDIPF